MTEEEFENWLLSDSAIKTILVETSASISGVETPVYLSNRAYTSEASLTYDTCIVSTVTFTEGLSLDLSASIGRGDTEIRNNNGDKDSWYTYVWHSRPWVVKVGDPQWAYADFRTIFSGVIAGSPVSSNRNNIIFRLLNKLDNLNNPVTELKLGGTTPNADEVIPVILGEVHNMEPLLIDNNQTYQVHSGSIEDIIEVRDNGDPRSDITENLSAGTFVVADYDVVNQLTVSVQGKKTGGVYRNDISSLVQILATEYGTPALRFTVGDLDLPNLSAFSAAHPQPVGVKATTEGVLSTAQELAASVGAQVVTSSQGKLRLIQLSIPSSGGRAIGLSDIEFDSFKIAERTRVRGAVKLAYCKNYTPQDPASLARGLPSSSANLFKDEWLTHTESDLAVTALYRLTEEPEQETTLLLKKSDAVAEATRRLNLWKVQRTVYEMVLRPNFLTLELGDTVRLTFPRYGLDLGKSGIVLNISRDWFRGRVVVQVLL